jgi:hypothetical protein
VFFFLPILHLHEYPPPPPSFNPPQAIGGPISHNRKTRNNTKWTTVSHTVTSLSAEYITFQFHKHYRHWRTFRTRNYHSFSKCNRPTWHGLSHIMMNFAKNDIPD